MTMSQGHVAGGAVTTTTDALKDGDDAVTEREVPEGGEGRGWTSLVLRRSREPACSEAREVTSFTHIHRTCVSVCACAIGDLYRVS